VIRDAVTCDRDGCVALFLEPVDDPYALDTDEFEDVMKRAGWTYGDDGHRCPGCVRGTGPVLELGECPRCTGTTVDIPAGARCHYCGHVEPHPKEEW